MDACSFSDTCGVHRARVRLSVGACAVVLGITRALLLLALKQRGLLLGASYWDLCATWAVPALAALGGKDGRCDQVSIVKLAAAPGEGTCFSEVTRYLHSFRAGTVEAFQDLLLRQWLGDDLTVIFLGEFSRKGFSREQAGSVDSPLEISVSALLPWG